MQCHGFAQWQFSKNKHLNWCLFQDPFALLKLFVHCFLVEEKWEMGLNTRQWVALMTFYTAYLFFGAIVFYHIEHELEGQRRAQALEARIEVNGKHFIWVKWTRFHPHSILLGEANHRKIRYTFSRQTKRTAFNSSVIIHHSSSSESHKIDFCRADILTKWISSECAFMIIKNVLITRIGSLTHTKILGVWNSEQLAN